MFGLDYSSKHSLAWMAGEQRSERSCEGGHRAKNLVRRWYQPHLEQRFPDAVVRARDLDQRRASLRSTNRAPAFSPT
jgi:hypothetical protein